MDIRRGRYIQQLIDCRWNGQVKVITGIRQCGKSYLLRKLYKDYLMRDGVPENRILTIELDAAKDIQYRHPLKLASAVRKKVAGKSDRYYLFIDEIQMSYHVKDPHNPYGQDISFYEALNELRKLDNLDIYVTGSSAKMLSSEILTEFRGCGDEIRVHPLSFSEYYDFVGGDKEEAFDSYSFYGGMPLVLSQPSKSSKMKYLESLFLDVYISDIVERRKIEHTDILAGIIDILCSPDTASANPKKVADALRKGEHADLSQMTAASYIRHLEDAFLFSKCRRYDIKGKSYFDRPYKYYCEDIGLRNARAGFNNQESASIMENIVYNELIARGYSVDTGVIISRERNRNGSTVRVPHDIDFVASCGGRKIYIQSAPTLVTKEAAADKLRPLSLTGDSFLKMIIRRDVRKRWYDENGVLHIGIVDFLLDFDSGLCNQ